MKKANFFEFKITGFRMSAEGGGESIQVEPTFDLRNIKKMLAEELSVAAEGDYSDWVETYLIAQNQRASRSSFSRLYNQDE